MKRCFCIDCLHSNYHELRWKVFFSLCPGLKTLSSVYILSVKLSAPQIFLFDGQAWKNSMEIIGYNNIYLLYKYHTLVYFLFHGLIWKSFAVFIKHFPVWQSGLKIWFQVNKNFQFFRWCGKSIKCQCCPYIETSQLIWCANQLTFFYMRTTLALNGISRNTKVLDSFSIQKWEVNACSMWSGY